MLRKKLFRIILVFLALDLFIACCCHCEDDAFYFSHCEMEVFHLDHSNETPVLAGASVPKEAYGIQTKVTLVENTCALNRNSSFLFSSAYATSCDCPQSEFLLDDIVSIQVFTVNDFNIDHPANSEISNYFKVLQANEYHTLGNFIAAGANNEWNRPLIFNMFLLQAPMEAGTHQFLVRIRLSDDRVMEVATETILLS